MLIQDEFGIIQNLQMSPISQTFLGWDFFCHFLTQTSSSQVHRPFGLSSMQSTLDFCSTPARKEMNVTLHKRSYVRAYYTIYCELHCMMQLLLGQFLSGHNFDDSLIYLQIELINGNSVQFYCFVMCVAKFCQNVFDFQVK